MKTFGSKRLELNNCDLLQYTSAYLSSTAHSKGGSRGVSKVSRNWSDHLWLVFACISIIMSMLPYSYSFMCRKPDIKIFLIHPSTAMNLYSIELYIASFGLTGQFGPSA